MNDVAYWGSLDGSCLCPVSIRVYCFCCIVGFVFGLSPVFACCVIKGGLVYEGMRGDRIEKWGGRMEGL